MFLSLEIYNTKPALQHYICFCVYFTADITLSTLRILKYFKTFEDDNITLRNLKKNPMPTSGYPLHLGFQE